MSIRAEREDRVDYEETARLANRVFGATKSSFEARQLQWFYERCFSQGAAVIALRHDGLKVGQMAMVRQTIMTGGRAEAAVQLVDLFVLPEHRGRRSLEQLFGAVEEECVAQDIRFAIGMPNAVATGVNEFFFKLQPFLRMPLCMGVALPFGASWPTRRTPVSYRFDRTDKSRSLELFARFRTSADINGQPWDETSLFDRLCGYKQQYGVHALDDLLLISSPRLSRGISYTLLCGFLTSAGTTADPGAVRALVHSACAMWRRRVFAYAGVNSGLASLPGIRLPDGIRPSPLLVQLRDFKPDREPLRLDRFQLLDFDFA